MKIIKNLENNYKIKEAIDMKVAVSFIKSKYDEKETINKINNTDADFLHVDVMDGSFVETKNFSFQDFLEWQHDNEKMLDVHLMCANPKKYIKEYVNLNTEYITIHAEIDKDLKELLSLIHCYGINAGLSINPNTSVDKIKNYLYDIEQVLIMSVEPGKGGQDFMESVTTKIDELVKIREENGLNFIISIDGGINEKTIKKVQNCDMVVSGSFVCMNENFQEQIDMLR